MEKFVLFLILKEFYVNATIYWHKERIAATFNGGFLGDEQKRDITLAGEWSIAICKAGIYERKTYYNNL